ncbi:MAG: hypothetical protein ACHQRL_09980 [Gemmatimonadales bacterium]
MGFARSRESACHELHAGAHGLHEAVAQPFMLACRDPAAIVAGDPTGRS